MTSSLQLFKFYSSCSENEKIKIAYDSFSSIIGKCLIKISEIINLKYVHVSKLVCNLLFVSKLSKDSNCCVTFFESHCIFQDQSSGRTIGSARMINGLLLF